MTNRRLLSTLLGAALLTPACHAPATTSPVQPGEAFANVVLHFES